MLSNIEYQLIGTGEQTLIFLNGFRMPFSSWQQVTEKLSGSNVILQYNRAGVGKTKRAITAQCGKTVVNDLDALLAQLDIQPPYILVAHSLGGIYANLFARKHPSKVSAIAMIDCPHPEEIQQQKQIKPPFPINDINNVLKWLEKKFHPFKYSEDEEINNDTGTTKRRTTVSPYSPSHYFRHEKNATCA